MPSPSSFVPATAGQNRFLSSSSSHDGKSANDDMMLDDFWEIKLTSNCQTSVSVRRRSPHDTYADIPPPYHAKRYTDDHDETLNSTRQLNLCGGNIASMLIERTLFSFVISNEPNKCSAEYPRLFIKRKVGILTSYTGGYEFEPSELDSASRQRRSTPVLPVASPITSTQPKGLPKHRITCRHVPLHHPCGSMHSNLDDIAAHCRY